MKLSRLLTATVIALTFSLPVFAADDAAAEQTNMDAKAQKADAAQMKDMKVAAANTSMKNTAMKEEAINVNTADAAMIAKAKLKGIGMKKAEAIIAYREKNGNFQSIDDLANVKGITKKIITKNKHRLTIG